MTTMSAQTEQRKNTPAFWVLRYDPSSLLLHAIAPLAFAALLAAGLTIYVLSHPTPAPVVYLSLLAGIFWSILWGAIATWRDLCVPMIRLREWVMELRCGNLDKRLVEGGTFAFKELTHDLNDISDMLQSQSENTEQQLAEHLKHLKQKQNSLQILYDVAASVNTSRDLNDLLTRFLYTLKDVANARAATVRLLTSDNRMQLVASTGLDDDMVERELYVPAETCVCGKVVSGKKVLTVDSMLPCSQTIGREFFDKDSDISMIAVPLQYRNTTLGVYNLFVERDKVLESDDLNSLFLSIGRHLGVAIEKSRLDQESGRLILMEERTRMAHELHDSLAQTLVSLRFQVRVLDETLQQDDEKSSWETLELLENTLDEANTELRELISRFRAPMSKRGLLPSVEKAIERFRSECTIPVFLQKEWPDTPLPPNKELQVLRIIQESLANIRKHSEANAVRIMLKGDQHGNRTVLIEDDGVGITGLPDETQTQHLGEHIGLKILKDRAKQLDGNLKIESEVGEGTRIELNFKVNTPKPDHVIKPLSFRNLHEPQSSHH